MLPPEDVSIIGVIHEEVAIECAKDDTENNLEGEDEAQNIVDFLLNLRHLVGLALRIHHDLAISSRIDHQAVYPLCIL